MICLLNNLEKFENIQNNSNKLYISILSEIRIAISPFHLEQRYNLT